MQKSVDVCKEKITENKPFKFEDLFKNKQNNCSEYQFSLEYQL